MPRNQGNWNQGVFFCQQNALEALFCHEGSCFIHRGVDIFANITSKFVHDFSLFCMFCCGYQTQCICHTTLSNLDRPWHTLNYRQVSNIRRTKSQQLKDSRTVLGLSLPNPLKPDIKSRTKMLQLHLSDRQFYFLLRCVLYQRFYGIYQFFIFFVGGYYMERDPRPTTKKTVARTVKYL